MLPGLTARKSTDWLVVHCSASLPNPDTDVKTIDRWHRQRGFLMIGYHYVIKTDGTIEPGRDEDAVGAHVEGFNSNSIGICMVGGVDKNQKPENNFSAAQFKSLSTLLDTLEAKYPSAILRGHRDFPNVHKACPSFNVVAWRKGTQQ